MKLAVINTNTLVLGAIYFEFNNGEKLWTTKKVESVLN